jgi:Ring finger domain
VPQNVTRKANLPTLYFNTIALAPWVNSNCTRSYLQSAHLDQIRAFIFYVPDNGTAQPPDPNSPVWNMYDGGQWRSDTLFPVYAVPGHVGNQLMTQLSLYSGNLTSVPNGHVLLWNYQLDPSDYVKVYTEISIDVSTSLPGLWVFLLVVIGGILGILGTTSMLMHFIQRRRRSLLRRRVARGEVDLEALGIKRLTVPKDHIERMPMYTYKCGESRETTNGMVAKRASVSSPAVWKDIEESTTSSESVTRAADSMEPPESPTDQCQWPRSAGTAHAHRPHSQPTCPICLDDFESGITTIRELPCGHIFHPECIDSFLGNNSSLCPMCKKSALPLGHCPIDITNGMVRRERAIRRLRSRVTTLEDISDVGAESGWRHPVGALLSASRVFSRPGGGSVFSQRSPSNSTRDVPLQIQQQQSESGHGPSQRRRDPGLSRRERAQQRARELLGNHVTDPEAEEVQQQAKCRLFLSTT